MVHEVEGVIAEDEFIGPYRSQALADRKAASIERASKGFLLARVEPISPGSISASAVIGFFGSQVRRNIEAE